MLSSDALIKPFEDGVHVRRLPHLIVAKASRRCDPGHEIPGILANWGRAIERMLERDKQELDSRLNYSASSTRNSLISRQ